MTYCEKIGLKIGDSIRVLLDCGEFVKGEILTLSNDDGSACPDFSDQNGDAAYFLLTANGGEGLGWERVKDEREGEKMTYCEKIGLKIGDKIRVLRAYGEVDCGEILKLGYDNGFDTPDFSDKNGDAVYFRLTANGGEGFAWERAPDGEDGGREMTPCEKLGYKVGDDFMVLASIVGFKSGQVVTLFEDDGSGSPLFKGDNNTYTLCDGKPGAHLLLDKVCKIGAPLPDLINKIKEAPEAQREAEFLVDSLVEEFEEKFEAETGLKCSVDTIFSRL